MYCISGIECKLIVNSMICSISISHCRYSIIQNFRDFKGSYFWSSSNIKYLISHEFVTLSSFFC
jgi:hypothetical protein